MNKKLSLAVAGAVLAFSASANAGITIPAGDWTVDIGGNVNAFYTHTNYSGTPAMDAKRATNVVQTGLLPSALGIGGKSRQNDLDVAFQFTFFVGADSGTGAGAGGNSLNIRQAFGSFGDKSWGTIKYGRDLGTFGSDAILSDMTLLGVGGAAGAGGTSTLGRIGSGYMYADWVGQIQYASPNWNGFAFQVALREPWSNGVDTTRSNMGYEGKITYDFAASDVTGRVWASAISQKHEAGTTTAASTLAVVSSAVVTVPGAVTQIAGYTSTGFDVGAKVAYQGFGLVGYYYDGQGLSGAQGALNGVMFLGNANESDDNGGYVQATFTIPGVGTKLGASWGESMSTAKGSSVEYKNESWIVGAYHPLTKSLNLVAEYTDNKFNNVGGVDGVNTKAKTVSLGAIMFF